VIDKEAIEKMTAIREYRIKKGISQAQLAKLMETTQAAVAMWETGARMPRADKLPKLAEVLGCSVADLFAKPETA
jgi:transcriptional regulator with XRE-family HTH domain